MDHTHVRHRALSAELLYGVCQHRPRDMYDRELHRPRNLNTSFIQPIIPLTFNDFSPSLGISLAFQFHFWWERKRNAIDAIAAVLKLR
jgi:hypothetical protein